MMDEQESNSKTNSENGGEEPKEPTASSLPPLGSNAPRVTPSPDVKPLDLDPVEEEHPDIKKLDVCPNCGEPMRDIKTLVCLRCGFNLKSMDVTKTETGEATADEDEAEEVRPLCPPGIGHRLLPLILAAVGATVLTIGYFTGAGGLYRGAAADGFWDHLGSWIQFILFTVIWSGCGIGALYVLAHVEKTKVGDLRLAVIRLLAISCASTLVMFLDIKSDSWELVLEIPLLAGAFILGCMLLFQLRLQAAALLGGATLLSLLAILALSNLITWSAPGQ